MATGFVWKDVDYLTNNYHEGGGCFVVAANLERAKAILREQTSYNVELATRREEAGRLPDWPGAPDRVYDVGTAAEEVIVFPNAGCC